MFKNCDVSPGSSGPCPIEPLPQFARPAQIFVPAGFGVCPVGTGGGAGTPSPVPGPGAPASGLSVDPLRNTTPLPPPPGAGLGAGPTPGLKFVGIEGIE